MKELYSANFLTSLENTYLRTAVRDSYIDFCLFVLSKNLLTETLPVPGAFWTHAVPTLRKGTGTNLGRKKKKWKPTKATASVLMVKYLQ